MQRFGSLRTLSLLHGIAFLALVALTGIVGSAALMLRHEASEESLRLNQLMNTVQETRGDLYRQMKEVFDHQFLGDPDARDQYAEFGDKIGNSFLALETLAIDDIEREAVDKLRTAYETVRADTDGIMASQEPLTSVPEAFEIFDERLEGDRLSGYEAVFSATEELLAVTQTTINARVETLTWISMIILFLPIVLAAALLLFARSFLKRAFVDPVSALIRATEEYRAGRLNHRVSETGAAELVTLERSINQMAVDLKDSREALVRSEKQAALGALVPVIAHNIRNPLASIRATAQVTNDGALSEDAREGLLAIVSTVDRLETWLASLLAYLNPTSPSKVVTQFTAIAEGALSLLDHKLREKAILVHREGWSRQTPIHVDRHLMEQAIYGLLANAVDASPPEGQISLRFTASDDEIELTIIDEGPGLGFSPDPRGLTPGPTTKTRGSGLGIPFAFRICEMHAGRVTFGQAEGGGACVTIVLPMKKKEVRSAA
ncbi:MAG: sensor histidine kinase [Rhodospirillaceae bacterium]|nr:sensor histidine kinase [Rhodospirillaceae bacterium]